MMMYITVGDGGLKKEKIAAWLSEIDDPFSALNQLITTEVDQAIAWLAGYPFGDGPKVCRLSLKKPTKTILERLLEASEHWPAVNMLVLELSTLDKRTKAAKALIAQCAELQEFKGITPWDTEGAIRLAIDLAALDGVELDYPFAKALVLRTGHGREAIEQAVKLISVHTISARSIEVLVPAEAVTVLDIASALVSRDTDQVFSLWAACNAHPLELINHLGRRFRKLFIVNTVPCETTAARLAGIKNPKQIYHLKRETKGINPKALVNATVAVLDANQEIKRGILPPDIAINKMLCRILLNLGARQR